MSDISTLNPLILTRILGIASLEALVLLAGLSVISWGIYKAVFRSLNSDRKEIFRKHYLDLTTFSLFTAILYSLTSASQHYGDSGSSSITMTGYLGLMTITLGTMAYIKMARIYGYIYFFYSSKKAGVPVLLVNILSLILSLICTAWLLQAIFDVRLSALLATSALVSVVLGLALQDTLGNLFAGIALQIDKPFEIHDWVEIKNETDHIRGQVIDLTWRSTIIKALTEEVIHTPNRLVAQSLVLNFSLKKAPFIRSQIFRIPFDGDISNIKNLLISAAEQTTGIDQKNKPRVMITQTTESWIELKVIMWINDFGSQFKIADEFYDKALATLRASGVSLASNRMKLEGPST